MTRFAVSIQGKGMAEGRRIGVGTDGRVRWVSEGGAAHVDALSVKKIEAWADVKYGRHAYKLIAQPMHTKPNPGDAIVQAMRRHLGEHETPAGSNRGALPDRVLDFVHCPRANPWCAALGSYALAEAGHHLPGGGTAGCGTARANAERLGMWIPAGSHIPLRGWAGIIGNDEHFVIVERANHSDVWDISGNTSSSDGHNYNGGCVAEHTHPMSLFSGFIRTY